MPSIMVDTLHALSTTFMTILQDSHLKKMGLVFFIFSVYTKQIQLEEGSGLWTELFLREYRMRSESSRNLPGRPNREIMERAKARRPRMGSKLVCNLRTGLDDSKEGPGWARKVDQKSFGILVYDIPA